MKLTDKVTFVGVLNPALRVFDIIMRTEYGTSYNAYLVKGSEKTALIDASHESFKDNFIANVEAEVAIEDIDYLIVNHTEPDHSGAIRYLLEKKPDLEIYGTHATLNNLKAITGLDFTGHKVADGETLSLGDATLTFMVAPNIHWPDTMMTWYEEEGILFSCDFLGAHYAEPTMRMETMVYPKHYLPEFHYYYAGIMGPFKPFVLKALDRVESLPIAYVAPSHGPILNAEEAKNAMALYREWSTPVEKEKKSVAIYYVSAYGYTQQMAEYLAEKLEAKGLDVAAFDIIKEDEATLAGHLEADALLFGSPTINRAALKPVWDVISSIDAVTAANKPYATFGCYGWSGEAVGQLNDRLNGIKMKQAGESVRSRFMPTDDTYAELDALADQVAQALQN